jgi:predicted transcriptional regulator of viral defense system
MAERGQYYFSTHEVVRATGLSMTAVRAALRRLKGKRIIADPCQGFHVILSPEYRRLGCLPASHFIPQLMDRLGLKYYAALLTAVRYHLNRHQNPQVFQVMTERNRPAITCDRVRVEFAARANMAQIPTVGFKSRRGEIRVSTLEATAFDLVGYARLAGGLDHVAKVLADSAERMEAEALPLVASRSPLTWAQRLGYLLSLADTFHLPEPLAEYVRQRSPATTPLDPGQPIAWAPRDRCWRLIVNRKIPVYL